MSVVFLVLARAAVLEPMAMAMAVEGKGDESAMAICLGSGRDRMTTEEKNRCGD